MKSPFLNPNMCRGRETSKSCRAGEPEDQDWVTLTYRLCSYCHIIASTLKLFLQQSEVAYLLLKRSRLRCGGCLFCLHLGHQWEGCQTRSRSSCCCGDNGNSTTSHGLSDGALRLRGWGLFIVETLGVAAWRGDLEMC